MSHYQKLIQTSDDIRFVLALIERATIPARMELTSFIDSLRKQVKGEERWFDRGPLVWKQMFVDFGAWALDRILQTGGTFDDAGFIDLLTRKHDAYGPGPINSWGEIGVVIRIDSKLERFFHLMDSDPDFESRADTLNDIIGYAVLGYLYVHKNRASNG